MLDPVCQLEKEEDEWPDNTIESLSHSNSGVYSVFLNAGWSIRPTDPSQRGLACLLTLFKGFWHRLEKERIEGTMAASDAVSLFWLLFNLLRLSHSRQIERGALLHGWIALRSNGSGVWLSHEWKSQRTKNNYGTGMERQHLCFTFVWFVSRRAKQSTVLDVGKFRRPAGQDDDLCLSSEVIFFHNMA